MIKKTSILIRFVLTAIFLSISSHVNADEISIDQIFSNISNALDSMKDYSCNFVITYGDNPFFAKLNQISEQMSGKSMPKESVTQVWIKSPNMMKTKSTYNETIIKKLNDGVYATYWIPTTNAVKTKKMPDGAWPSWPHPQTTVKNIKSFIDNKSEYKIEEIKDEGMDVIKLSFGNENSGRDDVYYIRKLDWMIYKSVVLSNGIITQATEWRDIKLNSGIDDSIFDLTIPENAKAIL